MRGLAMVGRSLSVRSLAAMVSAVLLVSCGWVVSSPELAVAVDSEDLVAETEAAARVKAAQSGRRVEVASFRSERREVFANPDGTMTGVEHTRPVRTFRDGAWVPVDPTLQRRPNGSLAPAAATVDMVFSGGGDGPLVTVSKAGKSVSLGWDGRLPAPVLDGSRATYPGVLPGVDLVVTADVDGFSHVLVVKDAKAAANPALTRIDMPVTAKGATLRATASGGVEVVDGAAGGVMLAADTPAMWDSSGGADVAKPGGRRAELAVAAGSRSLTLTPHAGLLRGADTVYPVFIDPVWRDEFRSAYAMVDSGYPNEEYWSFDGRNHEGLGLCPYSDDSTCNGSRTKRLFYRVSTSFYSKKQIISAEFGVTLRDNWKHANVSGDQADLYVMSGGISTATNWSNQPSGTKVATAYPGAPSLGSCSYNDGAYATEWGITATMQSVANNGTGTVTFGLRNATESTQEEFLRYCDNGHLRVNYNTPPSQPKMSDLSMSPGSGCSYDLTSSSYVNKKPKLSGYLFDPDHGATNEWGPGGTVSEQLRAQFKLVWGANDAYTWTAPLTAAKASGSRFELDLAIVSGSPNLPINEPIGWIVRAYDGHSYGPWSWDGTASRCRFVIDPTAPDPPQVTSTDFPKDVWVPMVGEYGTINFKSAGATSFRYDFTGDEVGSQTVTAAADHTASVRFMPDQVGPHVLTVEALDYAGNTRSGESYPFAVYARGAIANWLLADQPGSTQAADEAGTYPAAPGSGVTFGVPGVGALTAAHLDGTNSALLSSSAPVATGEGFAVSAWLRLDDLTRCSYVVRSPYRSSATFVLYYTGSSIRRWSFSVDGDSVSVAASPGGWTHLAGVYDAGASALRLYVNGTLAGTGIHAPVSGSTTASLGGFFAGIGNTCNLLGDLAEVKVFDRVVFADEVQAMATLTPQRQGYWQLNEAVDGVSPDFDGGQALTLAGGASIFTAPDPDFGPFPLIGTGHLELNSNSSGYAYTPGAVLDTTKSFSLSTRVKLASAQPGQSMTVLALPGTNTNVLAVRYSATSDRWEAVLSHKDEASPVTTTVTSSQLPASPEFGQFLAVVYNAFTDELTLYVDGVATTTRVNVGDLWAAAGGLQVGRLGSNEYFSGVIDDMRIYKGVLTSVMVQRLMSLTEQDNL